MKSVILDFSSSGEGNGGGVGGGGFCAMCRQTSGQRGFVATILESDPQVRRLFRAFSPAEKIPKKTSAMIVAESPASREFGAPRPVPAGDRHMNKSAPSDQVQSSAAKGAPSVQISSAR